MDIINKLISLLIAIQNFCKDIHYNCKGDAFYGKHLLVDRIQENISDYIDGIKEVYFLAGDKEPLASSDYLNGALNYIPSITGDDKADFVELSKLLITTLQTIEDIDGLTVGEENLIGNIAENLQSSLGLVNRQIR